ncbi:hypothetical protein MKW92_004824 [Papaver armeniacum]|nr:hypothetical protein MKW92_004824 [Papaver armeniacum]
MDEDVEETLLLQEEEEALIRKDEEERGQVIAARLSKWKRPNLSPAYISQSKNIIFQQLEIDYVIEERHKELLSGSSGGASAAILRIFWCYKRRFCCLLSCPWLEPYFYINCPPGMTLMLSPVFVKLSRYIVIPSARMRETNNKNNNVSKLVLRMEIAEEKHYVLPASEVTSFLKIVSHYQQWLLKTIRTISSCQLEIDFWHFPEAIHDPVIQVANLVTLQGEDQPFMRNIMALKSCSPIVGVDVMSFETEQKYCLLGGNCSFYIMLMKIDFIRDVDPDIIIGYNICKFDLPYLIEWLGTKNNRISNIGRIRNSRTRVKDATFSSKVSSMVIRESKEVYNRRRVQFDLFQVMQRDYKLSSYSLNSVSAHFLGEQKEDVHHSTISDLQNGNSETRRRLAVYCLKVHKLMLIYNYVEMGRVTGVPISFLLSRGQSIKVLSQLLRKSRQKDLVLPNVRKQGSGEGTFEGATVLEARTGFYEKPIATLDLASLYPSIMMAYNLCYCTLSIFSIVLNVYFVPCQVNSEDVSNLNLPLECVNKTPSGETFVKSNLQKGILPEILEELLAARKRAKADLKEAKDPLEKAVLDGRQLALKISANSVYGFTGATVGQLPCLEISSSVTSYGRQMIEHTKKRVEDRFTTLNGYEHNAEVIYGDTDSVMVQFGVSTVGAAMNLGREAAELISDTFTKPIKLEFEKVYYPYLLINKKRYAGLYWTNPDKFDKMDTKSAFYKILIDRDIPAAVQYVKNTISDLLMNRMDLSLLVITKGDDYWPVKTAHVELAGRMRKRDAATAPNVGDRVPYVIIKAAKGSHFMLENNIPIDSQYYLENQISKQGTSQGSHTRAVSISTPSNSGIMRFAKKQLSCLGCKALISNTEQTLFRIARKETELYCKTIANVAELEILSEKLWTQCQECQGSLTKTCSVQDLPNILSRRKKAQKTWLKLSWST